MWEVERVGVDLISRLGLLAVIKTRYEDLHKVGEEKERFVLQWPPLVGGSIIF